MINKTIYTIGHSTNSIGDFIAILQSFAIEILVDIRRFPSSRKYPQFNAGQLEASLAEAQITYLHMEALGGRRSPKKDSQNTAWRNAGFRGYADYMESAAFRTAIRQLEQVASQQNAAIMCAEAVWWRCHRSLVADYLKMNGWKVWNIMGLDKAVEHPYTAAANFVHGKLTYQTPNLFTDENEI